MATAKANPSVGADSPGVARCLAFPKSVPPGLLLNKTLDPKQHGWLLRCNSMTTPEASVFISYSHLDASLVAPVVALLRASRVIVFRDADTIPPGRRWRVEIESAIRDARLVVVFCCQHSYASYEVTYEYRLAIELGKDVLPLKLDNSPMPPGLDAYQLIDFQQFAGPHHEDELPLPAPPTDAPMRVSRLSLRLAAVAAWLGWNRRRSEYRHRDFESTRTGYEPPMVGALRDMNATRAQQLMAERVQSAIFQRTGINARISHSPAN